MATEDFGPIGRKIDAIATYERHATDRMPAIDLAGEGNSEKRKLFARKLIKVEAVGSPYLEFKSWGRCIPGMPIPLMLLVQPSLIVDVVPKSVTEFGRHYGVTVSQFVELARRGYALPNILEWGGQRRTKYAEYEKQRHMLPIFNHEETRCRINQIRRNAMFSSMDSDSSNQGERRQRYKEILKSKILNLETDKINKILGTSQIRSQDDALERISHNCIYVEIFGSPNDVNIIRNLEDALKSYPAEKVLPWIVATKFQKATQYTACFGGTYNCSNAQYEIILSKRGDFDQKNLRLFDAQRIAFHEAILLAKDIADPIEQIPDEGDLTFPLDDDDFDDFLAFMEDNRQILNRTDDILIDFYAVAESQKEEDALKSARGYLDLYRSLLKDARGNIGGRIVSLAGAVAGAAVGSAAGSAIGHAISLPLKRRAFLAAVLAGAGAGSVSTAVSRIASLTFSDECDVESCAPTRIINFMGNLRGI